MLNVTGANVCTTPLGSVVQAKSALFYVTKYMAKPKVPLGQCLTTLSASMDHVKQYPSQAKKDAGSDKRTVQHYMTRTLNSLATQTEVVDTQASAALLGLKANVCTHSCVYFSPQDAMSYVQSLQQSDAQASDSLLAPRTPTEVFRSTCHSPLYTVPARHHAEEESHGQQFNDSEMSTETQHDGSFKMPILYAKHYQYRGKQLRNMSRFEFYTLLEIKPVREDTFTASENDTAPKYQRGRNKSTVYRFHPKHDIFETYYLQLRSKQPIPILTGRIPPHPPVPPPDASSTDEQNHWQSKANKFAMYCLVTFRSEPDAYDGTVTSLPYTWDGFCSWMEGLEHSSLPVDQFRAKAVLNCIYGLYSKSFHRELIFAYRSRDCTPWTEIERRAAKQFFAAQANMSANDDDLNSAINAAFFDSSPISHQAIEFAQNEHQFCAMQAEALDEIFQDYDNSNNRFPPNRNEQPSAPTFPIFCTSNSTIHNTFERISAYKEASDATSSSTSLQPALSQTGKSTLRAGATENDTADTAESFLRKQKLSNDQHEYLTLIIEHLHDRTRAAALPSSAPPPQILSLLTGDPGSGKTHTGACVPSLSDLLQAGHVASNTWVCVTRSTSEFV